MPDAGARSRSARDSRSRSDDGADCRTPRQNSHSTAAGGDGQVAYAWHPWVAQAVRVHEVVERTAGSVTRCSLVDGSVARTQEIPVWMLDAALCRPMRGAAHPVADLSALIALRALLSDVAAAPRRAGGEPAIASPEPNRGDRHGAPSPPSNPDAESSARLPRSEAAVGARRDPAVELVTATDAVRADRSGDAPAGRPRRRRDTRSAEPRR